MSITIRYAELNTRKQFLNSIREKMKEESSNSALMFISNSLDKNSTEKINGQLAMFESWIKEINIEMDRIEPDVVNELLQSDADIIHKYTLERIETALKFYENKNS